MVFKVFGMLHHVHIGFKLYLKIVRKKNTSVYNHRKKDVRLVISKSSAIKRIPDSQFRITIKDNQIKQPFLSWPINKLCTCSMKMDDSPNFKEWILNKIKKTVVLIIKTGGSWLWTGVKMRLVQHSLWYLNHHTIPLTNVAKHKTIPPVEHSLKLVRGQKRLQKIHRLQYMLISVAGKL